MANIVIAILQIILAVGFVIYWIYFFLVTIKDKKLSEIYLEHELSFPLPDLGLIVPTLIISAIGLILDNAFGIFFTILSGGALMFLGLIDLAFNLRKKGHSKSKQDYYTSLIIVALVLTMAVINIVYGWYMFNL